MSRPAKTSSKPLTREQLMNQRAAADFAAMDRINSDRSIEFRIMNERGPRFAPQPSERNGSSQASFTNDALRFSRVGGDFANSLYMRSRRPPGGG
jgi:hypothetical protein